MTELLLQVELPGGAHAEHRFREPRPCWIGREPSCDLVLGSNFVSRKHVSIALQGEQLLVCDDSANGTLVDDGLLVRSARAVGSTCELQVGPFRVRASRVLPAPTASPDGHALPDSRVAIALRRRIHREVLEHMELAKLDRRHMDDASLRPKVQAALATLCERLRAELPPAVDVAALRHELCDEILGLGPIEALLSDENVTEIMVIAPDRVFAERAGRIAMTEQSFTDEDAVRAIIERIVTPLGRRIDESTPMVDARLVDGSRVNAVIPPLARNGACLTIRKFNRNALTMEALVAHGALDERMARFLTRAVRARRNIVVAGGTGSGKTTLLNVLSASIDSHERVVTIEDAAELRLLQPHVVSLESRPPNLEGSGEVTIRDLLKNALRMRPDRILVGECRGGEAIDMLQAMNTGHDGSMTTTHANSPREAIMRLETLCLMAGLDLPLRAIRAQIAGSVHLIVQQARMRDGARRIACISELSGLSDNGDVVVEDIFRYEPMAADGASSTPGEFRTTGYLPRCLEAFGSHGLFADGVYL